MIFVTERRSTLCGALSSFMMLLFPGIHLPSAYIRQKRNKRNKRKLFTKDRPKPAGSGKSRLLFGQKRGGLAKRATKLPGRRRLTMPPRVRALYWPGRRRNGPSAGRKSDLASR